MTTNEHPATTKEKVNGNTLESGTAKVGFDELLRNACNAWLGIVDAYHNEGREAYTAAIYEAIKALAAMDTIPTKSEEAGQ